MSFQLARYVARRVESTPCGAWAALLLAVALTFPVTSQAVNPPQQGAASELTPGLSVYSQESAGQLTGGIEATIGYPFHMVRDALARPQTWCEIALLHLNNKSCRVFQDGAQLRIVVGMGRLLDEAANESLVLHWDPAVLEDVKADLRLVGSKGPLGTTDNLIEVHLTRRPNGQTLLNLAYSCRFGGAVRLAAQAYLGTVARDRVGFTTVTTSDGSAHLVRGLRGAIERSVMR